MSGYRRATLREVANVAGLGMGTVSRALSGSPLVKDRTRDRVLEVARALGYAPNVIARSMRTRVSMTVGFLVTDFANPLLAAIARGAEEELRRHGYSLLIANTGGDLERERRYVQELGQRQVDGLLMSTSHERAKPLLDDLLALGRPIVSMDRELAIPCDMVMADHASGLSQAASYLFSLNHRRIALITASPEISPGRERVRGFRAAFAEHGVRLDETLVRAGGLSERYGLEAAQALFANDRPPTAIIAGGNQILVGVLRALKTLRKTFPDDVSIVSCDDTPLTELSSPGITTVVRDLGEAGRVSAEMLLRRIRASEDSEPARVVLPTEIRLRGSCKRFRTR